jgi:hypothetical protein
MSLDIKSISSQVYRSFPELNGVQPEVKAAPSGSQGGYTLVYQTRVKTSTGKSILRRVKVVSSSEGQILKITSSK